MPSAAGVGAKMSSRRTRGAIAVGCAMLAAAGLASLGLTNHLFWDDEANTAIYARNLLTFGRLTAFDGTNLVGYAYGGSLGEDLGRELRVPGLPAYWAAAGMRLFGRTTLGGRIMFVVAGVISVGLLAVWLRRHLGRRFSVWLPALILAISPAYLLYIRNCRYYALGVMLTLSVWAFWAPGISRGRGPLFDRRSLLRYAGAAVAVALLISTHYLNAAAVLLSLPLFFLDRRYRQPRQYVLLAIIYTAAGLYGSWILATANPFAADYHTAIASALPFGGHPDRWTHFYMNLYWMLRDLGTHEFFPWCLALVFAIPWFSPRLRRLRPLCWRGLILTSVVLMTAVLAAALTPSDMGKGPTAEMRYVVPLIAVGAAVSGIALTVLWHLARPAAPIAFLLLVTTNLLHLGFLADRADRQSPWWPPTLYRYVNETLNNYPTGNEEMIGFLRKLPKGTTVRVWPGLLAYPPMFYAPHLHYCDQLTTAKPIREDLKPSLPDYLYKERSQPELILVPAARAGEQLKELELRYGRDRYELHRALPGYYAYTSKPEIPAHFFSPPGGRWQKRPGMAVLAASGSAIGRHAALTVDSSDAEDLFRLAMTQRQAGEKQAAAEHFKKALKIDPDHADAHFGLASLLTLGGELEKAVEHYREAVRIDDEYAEAHVNLGTALEGLGRFDQACQSYRAALKVSPDMSSAHYNLARVLARQGAVDGAIHHYRQTLKANPRHAKAHVNLGNCLIARDQVDEALTHFRAAVKINPGLVQAHAALASLLALRGDREGAIAVYRRALRLAEPGSQLAASIRRALEQLGARPTTDEPPLKQRERNSRE